MEHNLYDVHAEFWRDTYLAALKAGHEDPAAAADEAFLAFDSRFGEVTAIEKEIADNVFAPHHGRGDARRAGTAPGNVVQLTGGELLK